MDSISKTLRYLFYIYIAIRDSKIIKLITKMFEIIKKVKVCTVLTNQGRQEECQA